jgi:hypothetical protein
VCGRCDHLFDVLKAYSCLNTSLGYCQGMAPVVGGLMAVLFNDDLLAAEDDRTSTLNELAFWLLAIILDGHGYARAYAACVVITQPHTLTARARRTRAPHDVGCRGTTSRGWRG